MLVYDVCSFACLPGALRRLTQAASLCALVFLLSGSVLGDASAPVGVDCAKLPIAPASYRETISGTLASFDMIAVPGGEITVPDPAKKDATVTVKIKPFWIARTETTWDLYDIFVLKLDEAAQTAPADVDAVSRPSKPYGTADRGYGRQGYPVINVTYMGGEHFCKWLSAKTGRNYRLPTEAEWEYACRAGKAVPDGKQMADFAWFDEDTTAPVGKRIPNAWGIQDMLGNVGEWCLDLAGKPVLCGGTFEDSVEKMRPTTRRYSTPLWQANDPQSPKSKWWLSDGQFVGFRVVRDQNAREERQ